VMLLAAAIACVVVPNCWAMPDSVSPGCTTYCCAPAPGEVVGVVVGEGDPAGEGEGDVPSPFSPSAVGAGVSSVSSDPVAVGAGVLTPTSPFVPSSGRAGGLKSSQKAMTLPTKRASIVPRKTAGEGRRLAGSRQAAQNGPVPCCSQ
jgi:hypothetical protein